MRTTKNISVTMPPAMLKEVERLAKKEHRTTSELIREALRRYQRDRRWEEINAYGRAKAQELGITEEDVVPLVKQFRKEQRAKVSRKQPAK